MTDEPNHLPLQQLVDGVAGSKFKLLAIRTLEVDISFYIDRARADDNASLVVGGTAGGRHFDCLVLIHGRHAARCRPL